MAERGRFIVRSSASPHPPCWAHCLHWVGLGCTRATGYTLASQQYLSRPLEGLSLKPTHQIAGFQIKRSGRQGPWTQQDWTNTHRRASLCSLSTYAKVSTKNENGSHSTNCWCLDVRCISKYFRPWGPFQGKICFLEHMLLWCLQRCWFVNYCVSWGNVGVVGFEFRGNWIFFKKGLQLALHLMIMHEHYSRSWPSRIVWSKRFLWFCVGLCLLLGALFRLAESTCPLYHVLSY